MSETDVHEAPPIEGRRCPLSARWVVAWGALLVAGSIRLDRLRATTTMFFDEWTFVFQRRGAWVDALLEPHNGHLSVLPVAAFRLMFAVVGLDHQHPYRLMGLLVHAAVATAVAIYVRRRTNGLAGASAGGVVLLLGSGWQNVLWPFQIGFMGSVAAAVVAWLALDARTRRGDAFAAVCIGTALACSGLGISVALGSAARLLAERSKRRCARVLGPPIVLYGIWYLGYGESQGTMSNVPRLPRFVVDAAGGAVGGLAGRDLLWGHLGVGLLLGAWTVMAAQRRLGASILAPAGAVVANWALTAYSRADIGEPAASRYVYVGGVFVLLVAADAVGASSVRALPAPVLRRWPGVARVDVRGWSAAAIAVLCVWGNWSVMDAGAAGLRSTTDITRAELRAVEWVAAADPGYRPDGQRMPQVSAGPYLAAVDALGSPAATDAEVAASAPATRAEVDRVSLELMGLGVDAAGAPPALPPGADDPACVAVGAGEDPVVVRVDTTAEAGGALLVVAAGGPAEVRARRYADAQPAGAVATIAAGEAGALRLDDDRAPLSVWEVEVRGASYVATCP